MGSRALSAAMRRNDRRARSHPCYRAFVVHRISGVALALFLPVHFFVLSRALDGADALDGFLRWTDQPAVQLAEVVLVMLLSVHLAGGLRVLWLEAAQWTGVRKDLVAVSAGVAAATGLLFALAAGV